MINSNTMAVINISNIKVKTRKNACFMVKTRKIRDLLRLKSEKNAWFVEV